MSYRAGVACAFGKRFDMAYRKPCVRCDSCGARVAVTYKNNPLRRLAWFAADKAVPGWAMTRDTEGNRIDTCKGCRK